MSEPSNIDEANEKIAQSLKDVDFSGCGSDARTIAEQIKKSLEAVALVNLAYLQKHPECPKLYESDVVYDDSPKPREGCRAIPALLESKAGDASELVAWRIAELNLEGRPATVRVVWGTQVWATQKKRSRIFSPVVRHQDGSLEGPVAIIREKHS